MSLSIIVATGALYELGEWLVAILFAPDWADRYLGLQGDIWDAPKDMALEICGAILALAITHLMQPYSDSDQSPRLGNRE